MIVTEPRMEFRRSQSIGRTAGSPIAVPYRGGLVPMADEAVGKPFPRLKFPVRIASVLFSLALWWLIAKLALAAWSMF